MNQNHLRLLNALACLGICGILLIAQFCQYYNAELPCPLCLLQRLGFAAIGFGFILNAYNEPRASHYAIVLFGAIYTGMVGIRQILLHILPDTGYYGSPIFGLHLYTWSFIISGLCIFYTAFLLLCDNAPKTSYQRPGQSVYRGIFILLMLIVLMNAVTTFEICGLHACPDNPLRYLW